LQAGNALLDCGYKSRGTPFNYQTFCRKSCIFFFFF
jgi:hypothetical protein